MDELQSIVLNEILKRLNDIEKRLEEIERVLKNNDNDKI